MGFVATQTAFLCDISSSHRIWRNQSLLFTSSNTALSQTLRLINHPRKSSFVSTETLYLYSVSNNNAVFPVFAGAESDMELAEVELQISSPLEAFFNRYSSFFERFEAGKVRRIISSGCVNPENPSPSILVMLGSELFLRQLCNEYPDGLVEVNHFSFNVLADIKEQRDETRCFHISTTDFSEISGSFDAIFLNYFPVFSKSLPKLFKDVTRLCKPGATIVLSLAEDKGNVVSLKAQSGGLLHSPLPDEESLVKMISSLPLELVSFEDVPSFYLATLKFHGAHNKGKNSNIKLDASSKDKSEYPLYTKGEVVHGFGRGSKKLGFPTANLSVGSLPSKVARLSKGVYFGCAQVIGEGVDSNVHRMVMNIGNRPTFDKDDTLSLEVHILHDFGTDFYGKELRIAILGFIREEMQFQSVDELTKRIKEDVQVMHERLPDADFDFHKGVHFFSPYVRVGF
ncbi:hypothetical protein GOP47_0020796 [Adiantum capillus-veneris]|uniref:riboflavin kinase n=1 Tax=Adiantum capillus-veneris TaxID=13818 RepID=A0A9D4UBQ7_ADICA|nr:hypothetical protein GOP47_0020796 [Adiantum capillus-veneris]